MKIYLTCQYYTLFSENKIDEALPLKQGLKQILPSNPANSANIDEALPLKQGLKLSYILLFHCCISKIDEALPLKQGLKPQTGHPFQKAVLIDEALPLKQGLKQTDDRHSSSKTKNR